MPEDVREIALDEVNKLERQGPTALKKTSSELPGPFSCITWGKSQIKDIDIEAARKILK
jgi:ATP-dependent Lon protease